MEHITGAAGIDLKYSADSGGIVVGFVDLSIFNKIDAAEWDVLKKAAAILSKKCDFPDDLKIEIE